MFIIIIITTIVSSLLHLPVAADLLLEKRIVMDEGSRADALSTERQREKQSGAVRTPEMNTLLMLLALLLLLLLPRQRRSKRRCGICRFSAALS